MEKKDEDELEVAMASINADSHVGDGLSCFLAGAQFPSTKLFLISDYLLLITRSFIPIFTYSST